MDKTLRIATWNLDRSGIRGKARLQPQLRFLESVGADILVLTETHASAVPAGYPYILASEPDTSYHKAGESYVVICSRFPLNEVQTAPDNRYFTVCAEVRGPNDFGPVIVYGTIITYHGDGVREGIPAWSRHRQAVKTQTAEWISICAKYPNHLCVVAGDFNENLDGKEWYGVADAKVAIQDALIKSKMCCPTAAPSLYLMNAPGELSRSTVNQICISQDNFEAIQVLAWEGAQSGIELSDHNGIFIDVKRFKK